MLAFSSLFLYLFLAIDLRVLQWLQCILVISSRSSFASVSSLTPGLPNHEASISIPHAIYTRWRTTTPCPEPRSTTPIREAPGKQRSPGNRASSPRSSRRTTEPMRAWSASLASRAALLQSISRNGGRYGSSRACGTMCAGGRRTIGATGGMRGIIGWCRRRCICILQST